MKITKDQWEDLYSGKNIYLTEFIFVRYRKDIYTNNSPTYCITYLDSDDGLVSYEEEFHSYELFVDRLGELK